MVISRGRGLSCIAAGVEPHPKADMIRRLIAHCTKSIRTTCINIVQLQIHSTGLQWSECFNKVPNRVAVHAP